MFVDKTTVSFTTALPGAGSTKYGVLRIKYGRVWKLFFDQYCTSLNLCLCILSLLTKYPLEILRERNIRIMLNQHTENSFRLYLLPYFFEQPQIFLLTF